MTDPADLVREACTLLAGYSPRLERLLAELTAEGPAPGMHGRAAAAPVPGNPPAFFAYMSIWASARWAEELLLYAVGASGRDEGERTGGSDANTLRLLTRVIPKLAAGVDEDTSGLVLRELEQRVNDARCVRAIDEAQVWRPLPGRPCPYCGCCWLKADMDSRPVIIACFAVDCADGNGLRPVATMGTDDHGRPELAWADGRRETVPDLEG